MRPDRLVRGPLAHVKITRLIVTLAHPDHVGLAGWWSSALIVRSNVAGRYQQSVYHQSAAPKNAKMANACSSAGTAWTRA